MFIVVIAIAIETFVEDEEVVQNVQEGEQKVVEEKPKGMEEKQKNELPEEMTASDQDSVAAQENEDLNRGKNIEDELNESSMNHLINRIDRDIFFEVFDK